MDISEDNKLVIEIKPEVKTEGYFESKEDERPNHEPCTYQFHTTLIGIKNEAVNDEYYIDEANNGLNSKVGVKEEVLNDDNNSVDLKTEVGNDASNNILQVDDDKSTDPMPDSTTDNDSSNRPHTCSICQK